MDFFFFNDTATTEIYTLSLHDALPISKTAKEMPDNADNRTLARLGRSGELKEQRFRKFTFWSAKSPGNFARSLA